MTDEAAGLRETLARACRMLEMVGLVNYSGHITGRLPGGKSYYIHPTDLARSEVTPDDMIEVDLQGKTVSGDGKTPDELPIHTSVYRHREDVNCVIHMHPHYAIIPGVVGKDLVTVCHHASIFGAKVPVYPNPEKIITDAEADQMANMLGTERAVLMKGHGAVIAEKYVEAAFLAALHLEENARLLVDASAIGEPIPLSEEEIERAAAATFRPTSIMKSWSYFMEKAKKDGVFWD